MGLSSNILWIANNRWTYGDYCIGFRQDWGMKVGFSPVWYCSVGSRSLQQLNMLLKEAIDSNSKTLFGWSMFMFAHMKFVQSPLETKEHKFGKYRFYDEREWRLVPYVKELDNAELLPFLTEDAYREFKAENGGNSRFQIGVDFKYDDIETL